MGPTLVPALSSVGILSSALLVGIVAAHVLVQSGHHAVNFSTWGFSICKTAHRIWLRILPVILEKELKVLDYA